MFKMTKSFASPYKKKNAGKWKFEENLFLDVWSTDNKINKGYSIKVKKLNLYTTN
jgi:hypothetical protein